MKISYHTWKNYKECPKKFDLTARKVDPTVARNDYFAMYGNLVEKFFQMYCNIWKIKKPQMDPDIIREKVSILYKDLLRTSVVDWFCKFATDTKEDVLEQAVGDIITIMNSDNLKYFLNAKSEISFKIALKGTTQITGRMDFISGGTIIDGKGTRKMGKYNSKEQLWYYALLYYFHFKKMPEGLGFFYYRFNTYAPVDIDADILNEFRARVSLDIKQISSTKIFKATPCYKSCRFCDYRIGCQERVDAELKRKKPSKLDIPVVGDTIQEFGF